MENWEQQLKNREPEAFEQFVREYETKVRRTALRILGDEHLAWDASQEVFLRVWNSIDHFQGNSSLSTWLYRITVNTCIDFQRRQSRERSRSMSMEGEDGQQVLDIPGKEGVPHQEYQRQEQRRLVQQCIEQLAEHHRIVLVLRDVQGLSYEEISQILGCREGTMKSRLNRARDALRKRLEQSGYFDGD